MVRFAEYLIIGLSDFKKFFLSVAVLIALENNKVHALVFLIFEHFLKHVTERNELDITVSSSNPEYRSLENELFGFINDSIVDSKYALIIINFGKVSFLGLRGYWVNG